MFKINNISWDIEMVEPRYYKLYRSDKSLSVASCDNTTKTIYINKFVSGKFLRRVLIHEITHACMFSYNIILQIDQEELLADLLSIYGDEIIEITNKVFNKIKMGA